jgi:phosphoribosyl 1,2-cyclic phosphodiesterase
MQHKFVRELVVFKFKSIRKATKRAKLFVDYDNSMVWIPNYMIFRYNWNKEKNYHYAKANYIMGFGYIFNEANKYPGAPSIVSNRVKKNSPFTLNGKQVIPINAKHNTLQVFGYRIDAFAYLTDIKTISAFETSKLSGLEVLVVNALREEPHYSHFNLEEAIAFAQRVGAKKTYFTHISHHLGFHDQVALKLPENIYLAYDSLTISI